MGVRSERDFHIQSTPLHSLELAHMFACHGVPLASDVIVEQQRMREGLKND